MGSLTTGDGTDDPLRSLRLYELLAQYSRELSLTEPEMRAKLPTLAGLVALMSVSAQAAPLPPAKATPTELGSTSPIELVRQG